MDATVVSLVLTNGISCSVALAYLKFHYSEINEWDMPPILRTTKGVTFFRFCQLLVSPWVSTILSFFLLPWYIAIALYFLSGMLGGIILGAVLDRFRLTYNLLTFFTSSILAGITMLILIYMVLVNLANKYSISLSSTT
jgi:hypothetical protein